MPRIPWRKSSRSNNNGNCVEVAPMATIVAVRDSKHLDSGILLANQAEWVDVLTSIKRCDFDC